MKIVFNFLMKPFIFLVDIKHTVALNILMFILWPLLILELTDAGSFGFSPLFASLAGLVIVHRIGEWLMASKSKVGKRFKKHRWVVAYVKEQKNLKIGGGK
ncbi:hypothetical protein ACNE9Y_31560 [Pseudomonas sp. NY11226]|uniref:hypothetical protein n=1 Tax=Pseudomonas sp. NY11226 TaxID=3400362 RepID=UPI003A88E7B9